MIGKPTKRWRHGRLRWMVETRDLHGIRRMKFFPTKGEADAYQTAINRRPAAPVRALRSISAGPSLTVEAYGLRWLADSQVLWKPKTARSYHDALVQHVFPFVLGPRTLGGLRLVDLARAHVQDLVK